MSTTKYSVPDHQSAAMPETMARPQWLDEELYPFQSRFVKVEGNRMIQLIGSPLFRFLSVHFNLLLEYTLLSLTKHPQQPFSEQEQRASRAPMAERAGRGYPSDLFKSAGRSHDYLADLEQRLRALKQLPALLLFGETDGLLKLGWLTRFERLFPRHRSIVLPGCHHFPQVYDAPGVAIAIRAWWDEEIEP